MKQFQKHLYRVMALLFITALTACSTGANAKLAEGRVEVKTARAALIGNGSAVFYPANYDAAANLPSFAFQSEPAEQGALPADWKVAPVFFQEKNFTGFTIVIDRGTTLYGTGEVVGPLVRNDQEAVLWNTDNYAYGKAAGKQLYQSHPWVLAVRKDGSAFGVLADTTWRQTITLNGDITFVSLGPGFRVTVIEGASPQEVLIKLSSFIGTIDLPPLWSLGYHQCRYSYYPDARVREIADTFRAKQIPADVIWLDIHYMDGYRVFTFDRNRFPNPNSTNDYLHSLDFKSIWMIDPGVKQQAGYFVYDSGSAGDHWVQDDRGVEYTGNVWPGACVFPDFTQSRTRQWWADLYKEFMATGIDGVWNDMNEPSVFGGPGGTMPADNWHRGDDTIPAGPHSRYHNVYGQLMTKASREGIMAANPEKRPFVLTRSGFIGSQRYAATWTGDNVAIREHLELSIPMSLNLGLSGQPFSGPDIGGYAGNATPDLYADWIALGAFYPFSRSHTNDSSLPQEPWAFGPEVEETARVALNRRYRLLPYLYTLFRETSINGLPVMQPVFFADPADTSLRAEQEAFLLGANLMVVPQWAEKTAMPKGIWREISVAGENTATDPHQVRLLQKGGSIIPAGPQIQSSADYDDSLITLYVCPDSSGKASGTLYSDDGEGFSYRDGDFALTGFSATAADSTVTVKVKQLEGNRNRSAVSYRVALVTETGTLVSEPMQGSEFTVTF